MTSSTIIFVHIPKTAGRTLEFILEKQYNNLNIYDIYGYDQSIQKSVESLRNLSIQQKEQLQLIKGHYQFGLHHYLSQPVVYLTFLRDPVKRILSYYSYIGRDSHHPFYSMVYHQNMGIQDCINHKISVELNNGQTRLLSGKEHEYEFGKTPQYLLDEAIENIEKYFAFVGLVERFDESLILMRETLGYQDVCYVSRNVSSDKQKKSQLSQSTLELIQQYNDLDLQLYDYVQQKFNRLVEQKQELLSEELSKFKQENEAYQPFGKMQLLTQVMARKFTSFFR